MRKSRREKWEDEFRPENLNNTLLKVLLGTAHKDRPLENPDAPRTTVMMGFSPHCHAPEGPGDGHQPGGVER